MATVATLRVAPVKALATITPPQVRIDVDGVAEDRRLFLVAADDAVVTQRAHPQLVRVVPDLDLTAGTIALRLPDGAEVVDHLDPSGEQVHTSLFGRERVGQVVATTAANALSELLGEPVRIVLAPRTGIGWDEGPVSILGRASVKAIGAPDADARRFRMLVELSGTIPYEEDSWVGREVVLGTARVRVTQPLDRCVVITHSPSSARHDWDGLKVLAAQRGRDHLCLGVIAEVVEPGEVAVGDAVTVMDPAPS